MKISYQWLKSLLPVDIAAKDVAELLTSCGLETEEIHTYRSIQSSLDHVVIGEVLTCEKHPDADKLSVTTVNTGNEIAQIVCGAPNVAAGQKVLVALPGSKLSTYSGDIISIKKSKIRGVESNGMICAEDELGIGQSHDGIMVLPEHSEVGMSAASYLHIVEDDVFEIGLTPNRGDAFNHYGTAIDLKTVLNTRTGTSYKLQTIPLSEIDTIATIDNPIQVTIQNQNACKRYSGVYIENVQVCASPEWIQHRLKAIGIKPINNIVDATNYVLHELGQPIHAFDAEHIDGKQIHVRNAHSNENFISLDSKALTLIDSDIVIADTSKALCIAGVYGSINSGVTSSTKTVFIESAHFDASMLRKTGTRLQLRTDACMHFEKGIDISNCTRALKRFVYILSETCKEIRCSKIIDIYPNIAESTVVKLRYAQVKRLSGLDLDQATISSILIELGFEILEKDTISCLCKVPTSKTEVTREADIIEEILRIYGFDKVEIQNDVYSTLNYRSSSSYTEAEDRSAAYLTANGFFEMMSNPITQSSYYDENTPLLTLANSMTSELNTLRAHLLFGALESIAYNLNRKNSMLRLFEWGSIFSNDVDSHIQSARLGIYMSGNYSEKNWNSNSEKSNLFHLKSYVEAILKINHIQNYTIENSNNVYMNNSLHIKKNDTLLGELGSVKTNYLKKFDIKEEVYTAFIDWDAIVKAAKKYKIRYNPVSKFPRIKRDLALLVDSSCSYEALRLTSEKALKGYMQEISLFDCYEGDKIEAGKKSYAISYILGDNNKTLTDKDIDKIMQKVCEALERENGAKVRQ